MFTVALIGPDGAGKSTVGKMLQQALPFPLKYVYMGVNLEASNLVLPTTRLLLEFKRMRGGRPDMAVNQGHAYAASRSKNWLKRFWAILKGALRLMNLLAEEWFRQLVVWYYLWQDYCVIFDRHFYFDYYAHDVVNDDPDRPFTSILHGFILEKLYPKPDFVVFLDAPAEVLFARKPEGTLAALEERRQEYVRMHGSFRNYIVVDVSMPLEQVIHNVTGAIVEFSLDRKNNRLK